MPQPITLDLPVPLSVNRTRRIDWRNYKHVEAWQKNADAHFLLQKRGLPPPILGRFELTIVLQEGSKIDMDNGLKILIDSLRRFNLIANDSPKFMRRVVIEFGDVEGCRVTIRPLDAR